MAGRRPVAAGKPPATRDYGKQALVVDYSKGYAALGVKIENGDLYLLTPFGRKGKRLGPAAGAEATFSAAERRPGRAIAVVRLADGTEHARRVFGDNDIAYIWSEIQHLNEALSEL
jgi:hypothetical protein